MKKKTRGPSRYNKYLDPIYGNDKKVYLEAQASSRALAEAILAYARNHPNCPYGQLAKLCYEGSPRV